MIDLYRALGLGAPALMDVALLVARVVVGGMFFLSGFYKLFAPSQAEKMQQTMVEAGVVAPRQTARFVSVCEFVFGGLLILGLFTSLSALVLIVICMVALATVAAKSVEGASLGYRLSSYFDLPETLLIVILFGLIAGGPGRWSLDVVLFLPRP